MKRAHDSTEQSGKAPVQRGPRGPPQCNRLYLVDIAATDRAVHEVLSAVAGAPRHQIPPHDRRRTKGAVQRAVRALEDENSRADAVAEALKHYAGPAGSIVERYFRLLRSRSHPEHRESLVRAYSDLLFATLDAELMERVRQCLVATSEDGDETPRVSSFRAGSGISARLEGDADGPGLGGVSCDVCGNSTEFVTDRNDQMTCTVCFAVVDRLADTRRPHHPLSSAFGLLDRAAPFRDAMRRFQGQRASAVAADTIERTRALLAARGQPLETVSRKEVLDCLAELRVPSEHRDAVAVHCALTGRPAPSIHHLEETLLDDYCALLDEYDAMVDGRVDDARGLEHLPFLLFLLLRRNAFECEPGDFAVAQDFAATDQVYDVYRVLFGRLGWEYPASF